MYIYIYIYTHTHTPDNTLLHLRSIAKRDEFTRQKRPIEITIPEVWARSAWYLPLSHTEQSADPFAALYSAEILKKSAA